MRFVPGVEAQFLSLTELPETLGLNLSNSPDPSSCKHYQALARVEDAEGTPFFFMTRSGNVPSAVPGNETTSCDDSPGETGHGHLIVFRMGSRPTNGERLRSNRLRKGAFVDDTAPSIEDKAPTFFTVVGGTPRASDPARRPGLVLRNGNGSPVPRLYQHPGGMQVVGKMLALALEAPNDSTLPRTQIMFFDVSNPEAPAFRSQYTPINGAGETRASAGTVAITPLPSGHYLMMTTGGENTTWYYYRSTLKDLSRIDLSWNYVGSHPAPDGLLDPHQTLQFLRERNINGNLYLVGARGTAHPFKDDHDRLDLFRITGDTKEFIPGESLDLDVVRRGDRISPYPTTGGDRLANLAAASTFHVTPTGELLFYATKHDNEGPNGSVDLGEWRHIDMTRPFSPLLKLTAAANGPYEVDEGSQVTLTGSAQAPATRAWIQLFHERDFGGVDFHTQYEVIDFDDRELDDFDNFHDLESEVPRQPNGVANRAQSLKWYAPAGCSILLHDSVFGIKRTVRLPGNNLVQSDTDLRDGIGGITAADFNARIDAVEYDEDCISFFDTPYELAWDLNDDGSLETPGNEVTFSAANLDGPKLFVIRAQARHSSGGGLTVNAFAHVQVRNVKPDAKDLRISGVTNGFPNNNPPTVLMGLPVTVEAKFTDAGVHDRQSASINWGDGSVEAHTSFTTYADAFGGATGSLSHTHRYTTAGVRQIQVVVVDDDGGSDTLGKAVLVQSPADGITVVVARLDVLIAAASDETQRQNLELARQALAGSPKRPNDGAIAMIAAGNYLAALDLVNAAMASLRAAGTDAARLAANLEPVVASLVALSRL
jgi:hypothetical protein